MVLAAGLRGAALLALAFTLAACATENREGANWATEGDVDRLWSNPAAANEVTGWALMACDSQDRKAKACWLLKEAPEGRDIGKAALETRQDLYFREKKGGGEAPPDGLNFVPVVFCMADEVAECAQAKSDVSQFTAKLREALDAYRADNCPAALALLAKLDVPAVEADIARACAEKRSAKGEPTGRP